MRRETAKARPRIDYAELLEFLWDTFTAFDRRGALWIMAGMAPLPSAGRTDATLRRLTRQGLVVQEGRGREARYTITAAGRDRVARPEPAAGWDRAWDGKWRVLTYDLPERQRADRCRLWEALRQRKLGLLQRSVWVWPHELESVLTPIIQGRGIPDCFCGFTAGEVFLCSAAEVVATSWDWKRIDHDQEAYLTQDGVRRTALARARDAATAMRVAVVERRSYREALRLDPFLPRTLCAPRYRGFKVEQAHRSFRAELRLRAEPGAVTL